MRKNIAVVPLQPVAIISVHGIIIKPRFFGEPIAGFSPLFEHAIHGYMKLFDMALIRLIQQGQLTLEFQNVTPEQFMAVLKQGAYQALGDIFSVLHSTGYTVAERLAKIDEILNDTL